LAGITRESIFEIAKGELEIKPIERTIKPEDLKSADEVFLTGTGSEIVPVGSVDGRKIADGKRGPVTGALQTLYKEIVIGEKPQYKGWLTRVF
jgi:branched-chain amino acid aminotransferase